MITGSGYRIRLGQALRSRNPGRDSRSSRLTWITTPHRALRDNELSHAVAVCMQRMQCFRVFLRALATGNNLTGCRFLRIRHSYRTAGSSHTCDRSPKDTLNEIHGGRFASHRQMLLHGDLRGRISSLGSLPALHPHPQSSHLNSSSK